MLRTNLQKLRANKYINNRMLDNDCEDIDDIANCQTVQVLGLIRSFDTSRALSTQIPKPTSSELL